MNCLKTINCLIWKSYTASTGYNELNCRCSNCALWHRLYRQHYDKQHRIACNKSRRLWAKNNPEKIKKLKLDWNRKHKSSIKNTQLKVKFGITLKDYDKKLSEQDGRCAICFKHYLEVSKAFAVDHDHKASKIRGLLCHGCNVALGHFKDNLAILNSAVYYLTKWKELLKEL